MAAEEALEGGAQAPPAASGVLERLAAREAERAAGAAARAAEAQGAADPRESVEAWLADFAARCAALEGRLEVAEAAAAGGSSGGAAGTTAAPPPLEAAAAELTAVEQRLAESAYFLPSYDVRQATLTLGALRRRHHAAATALQPRRRFAFNRRPGSGGAAAGGATPAAKEPAAAAAPTAAGEAAAAAAAAAEPPTAAAAAGAAQLQAGDPPREGVRVAGLSGEVVAPPRGELEGRECTLADLEGCTVLLLAPLAALFMHRLRRCRVVTGPVAGATFAEGALAEGGGGNVGGLLPALAPAYLPACTGCLPPLHPAPSPQPPSRPPPAANQQTCRGASCGWRRARRACTPRATRTSTCASVAHR